MTKLKTINLSNKLLSHEHMHVLRRSLKVTPIPLPNKKKLMKNNAHQFSRKLCLLEFFFKENDSEEEKSFEGSIIKNKSAFNPQRSTLRETEIKH